jgi:uncharacterized OB-fold protein
MSTAKGMILQMSKQIFFPGALEEIDGKLIQIGSRCGSCGKTTFPAAELCIFCSSDRGEKVPLSTVGTVFSFCITRVRTGKYKPPFITAYIDLPEGTRVCGQIHGNVEEIKNGMKVRVETGVVWTEKDGTDVFGYYYVPCEPENGGV